jgi:hypothetical protein
MPIILKTDKDEKIILKFYALVVPSLQIPIFFANDAFQELGVARYLWRDLLLDTGEEEFWIPSLDRDDR